MKYLSVFVLSISFLTFEIYSKDIIDAKHKKVEEKVITVEQQDISDLRDDLLEKFNCIKTQLILVRTQIQTEMRKDNPDWDKIKELNVEQFRLQNILNEKKYEYREMVRLMRSRVRENKDKN